ncbi:MAG: hypothetical protein Q7S21_06500 [archaeon]|nr:hypothetical protein [archaeon]
MFELFLRKKSMQEFVNEEINTKKILLNLAIALLAMPILSTILSIANLIINNSQNYLVLVFFFPQTGFLLLYSTFFIFLILVVLGLGILFQYAGAKMFKGKKKLSEFALKQICIISPFILIFNIVNAFILGGLTLQLYHDIFLFGIIIDILIFIYAVIQNISLVKEFWEFSTIKSSSVVVTSILLMFPAVLLLFLILILPT